MIVGRWERRDKRGDSRLKEHEQGKEVRKLKIGTLYFK